jgi:phosphatidate cytidylyltransferase
MRFPLDASADLDEFERPPVVPIERHRPPTDLSHWDESAAEEVPNMSRREPYEGDEAAWSSVPGAGPRWRDDDADQRGSYDPRQVDAGRRSGPRGEPVAFDEYAEPTPGRSVFGEESPAGPAQDDYGDDYRDHSYDEQGYGQQPGYADESYLDDRGGYDDRGADRARVPEPEPYGGTTRPAEGFDRRQVFAQPVPDGPPPPRPADDYDDNYSDDFYDEGPEQAFPAAASSRRRSGEPRRSSGGGDRDMRVAIGVGVGLVVAALVLFQIGTVAAMALVTAILGLAAYEYFTATQRAGFDPLMPVGVTATVAAVLVAYNYGEGALPLVVVLSVVVCLVWYLIDAGGERPMANIGATLLGICWIGIFGSFAGLLLMAPNGIALLVAAIVPTIGYDVGALFVGRSAGSRPLSSASPNKTVEGLVGGMVLALLAGTLLGIEALGPFPFDSLGEGLKIGLVVAIAAPLGDLSESLIKRDLGIKDMGSLLPGHGGVLDRFDAMLFVLPAIWYLARVSDFFLT